MQLLLLVPAPPLQGALEVLQQQEAPDGGDEVEMQDLSPWTPVFALPRPPQWVQDLPLWTQVHQGMA